MKKRSKIQQIKMFIKISIIVIVFGVFIVLGLFVRPTPTFENSNIKKWLTLSDNQKITTLNRVLKDDLDQELMILCINKIATLSSGSGEMQIRDAAALCYNGIKLNSVQEEPVPDEK